MGNKTKGPPRPRVGLYLIAGIGIGLAIAIPSILLTALHLFVNSPEIIEVTVPPEIIVVTATYDYRPTPSASATPYVTRTPDPKVYYINDVLIDEGKGRFFVLYQSMEIGYIGVFPWLGTEIGGEIEVLEHRENIFDPLSLNSQRDLLASNLLIHDLKTHTSFLAPEDRSARGTFSPDGHWYATRWDDYATNSTRLRLYDETMSVAHEVSTQARISKIVFSPDSQMLAVNAISGYTRYVEVFSIPDFTSLAIIPFKDTIGEALFIAFSPDSSQIAVAVGQTVFMISLKDGTQWSFDVPSTDSLRHLALNPTGRWLATSLSPVGDRVRGTYVFDLESPWEEDSDTPPFFFLPTEGQIGDILFIKEGLVISESYGQITFWSWQGNEWAGPKTLLTIGQLNDSIQGLD